MTGEQGIRQSDLRDSGRGSRLRWHKVRQCGAGPVLRWARHPFYRSHAAYPGLDHRAMITAAIASAPAPLPSLTSARPISRSNAAGLARQRRRDLTGSGVTSDAITDGPAQRYNRGLRCVGPGRGESNAGAVSAFHEAGNNRDRLQPQRRKLGFCQSGALQHHLLDAPQESVCGGLQDWRIGLLPDTKLRAKRNRRAAMAVSPLPGWQAITKRAVRPDGVVVSAPGFDQESSCGQGIEALPVQELVADRAVEALAVAVLPWAAWRWRKTPGHCPSVNAWLQAACRSAYAIVIVRKTVRSCRRNPEPGPSTRKVHPTDLGETEAGDAVRPRRGDRVNKGAERFTVEPSWIKEIRGTHPLRQSFIFTSNLRYKHSPSMECYSRSEWLLCLACSFMAVTAARRTKGKQNYGRKTTYRI